MEQHTLQFSAGFRIFAKCKVSALQCTEVHFACFLSGGSYEIWSLQLKFETSVRSLKLIVWPQEVSEVTKVKMKKILGENPKITNFCLTKM